MPQLRPKAMDRTWTLGTPHCEAMSCAARMAMAPPREWPDGATTCQSKTP